MAISNGRSTRSVSRSQGSVRGRGRGGGRGSFAPNGKNRSTFYTTRIEEEVKSGAENPEESQKLENSEDEQVLEDSSSTSDDDAVISPAARSYNSLLQSLNSNIQRGPPQRKKRKIEYKELQEENDEEDGQLDVADDDDTVGTENEDGESDSEDDEDSNHPESAEQKNDPFLRHIADVDETQFEQKIQDTKQENYRTTTLNLRSGLSLYSKIPHGSADSPSLPIASLKGVEDVFLKQKLGGPAAKLVPEFQGLHQDLSSSIFDYRDVLFPLRTPSNADHLRKLSCIHLLNHLYKTRDRVLKNNARLLKENDDEAEFRDQGFTRPKVLVVVPTRNSCVKYIDILTALCEPEQQENKKRFLDSYARGEDSLSRGKPLDFRELFEGNDDDMFRLGMKFTRKTIKYFSQFYSSDIILASPLGLRMAIGAENDKKQDYDFLSSIEILLIDQANSLLMQNWEHVEYLLEHLNLQPKEAHGCDFSRVRNWYLDGNARFIRQTLLFSAFNFPALNRLFLSRIFNVAGKYKYSRANEGAMLGLGLSVKQTFSRFDYTNPASEPDERFNYFTTALLPIFSKHSDTKIGGRKGVLVYLPSYADFVRVRNYLSTSSTTQNISFGSISEYTSIPDVARARSHFLSGRHSVLLYTERAHHFRRYHLRGAKRVIMYGLPENPIFYKEVVGDYLGSSIAEAKVDASEASVRSLFSKLDMLKLERIVGTKRLPLLLKDKGGDTFEFL